MVTVSDNCQAENTEEYQKKNAPHLKCCPHETEEGRGW